MFNNFLTENRTACVKRGGGGKRGEASEDKTIRRMRFACWLSEATDTHSEYVILLFHGNNGYANAPHVRYKVGTHL